MNNPNKTPELKAVHQRGRVIRLLQGLDSTADRQKNIFRPERTVVRVRAAELAGWWGLDACTPVNTLKHELARCVKELEFLEYWSGGYGCITDWQYVPERQVFRISRVPGTPVEEKGFIRIPVDWSKMGQSGRDVFRILQVLAEDQYMTEWPAWKDAAMFDTVGVTVSKGLLKKVRNRVAWARFRTEMARWSAEDENKVCFHTGNYTLLEIPLVTHASVSEDGEVMHVTLEKRVVYSLQLIKEQLID